MLPETLAIIALSALLTAGAIALFVILQKGRSGTMTAQRHLDAGRYESAIEAAEAVGQFDRDALLAGAVAAKHLLDLEAARGLLHRLVRDDAADGEAWLELGLVAGYDGRFNDSAEAFDRVEPSRSDLLESLTLHRAWLSSLRGDELGAERLFGEIEVPLETKLRTDLGVGDPVFAEWFLQAGLLWRQRGDSERAHWALAAARHAAPGSRLIDTFSR